MRRAQWVHGALATWLLALLGACGGGGTADPIAPAPNTSTVPMAPLSSVVAPGTWVVLGSSTAAGYGAPEGLGWADQLAVAQQHRGVALHNLARIGLQSSQALPLGTPLPAGRAGPVRTVNVDAALAYAPALLVLAFPTNDALADVPAAETVAAWRTMAERAAAAGAATLVLSTQPRAGLTPERQATLEATDRTAAAIFGGCFVPLRAGLAGPDGALAAAYSAGDGAHLNAAGHAWVLAQVAAVLESGRCVRLASG